MKLDPDLAKAHSMLGFLYLEEQNAPRAEAHLTKALALDPAIADAHYMLGGILLDKGDIAASIDSFQRAIALDKSNPMLYRDLGMAYILLGKQLEANAIVDEGLTLFPDFCELHYYKGNLYSLQLDYAAAELCFSRALAMEKTALMLYTDLANAQAQQNKIEEAIKTYQSALIQFPDAGEVRMSVGISQLLIGDYANGWQNFEMRFKSSLLDFISTLPKNVRWTGEQDLTGKDLLLITEEGFGDTIQFIRFIQLLKSKNCNLHIVASKPMQALLKNMEGIQKVYDFNEETTFDYYLPLMSLPLVLGTTVATIPSAVPYITSDAECVVKWREKLGVGKNRPRIGIALTGNPQHKKNKTRSIELQSVVSLFELDADFIILQKDLAEGDQAVLDNYSNVRHFGPDMHDFSDTAALVELVDLVISVDTSIAHLAGAMDKPAWVLIEHNPDWRWMLNRTDSPWYPSVRLFRQAKVRDWDTVIEDVKQAFLAERQTSL
ncbi:tetratricopeptide repeat protein [Undibacterium sp. TJN19]|uniref:tetratricopeptide repeat-containing glycosyltransferase family protein n=1 Tax=Undibacterium sp. TJN19 TaxID=3413055 RepID=UPI003BF3F5D9